MELKVLLSNRVMKGLSFFRRKPSPVVEAIDRLEAVAPGWDSYEAPPVAAATRAEAKEFVIVLERFAGPWLSTAIVGPTAEGGVAIAWRAGSRPSVQIFFSPTGNNRYVVMREDRLLDRGSLPDPETFLREVAKRYIFG